MVWVLSAASAEEASKRQQEGVGVLDPEAPPSEGTGGNASVGATEELAAVERAGGGGDIEEGSNALASLLGYRFLRFPCFPEFCWKIYSRVHIIHEHTLSHETAHQSAVK